MTKKKERFEILLEDLQSQFRVAFEGITALNEKFQTLVTIDQFNEFVLKINDRFQLADRKIDQVYIDLQRQMETIAKLLKADIERVEKSLSGEIKEVREELKETREELKETREELKETREELGGKIDVIDQKLEQHIHVPTHLAHV